ncbi:MAG: hypothetical protein ACYSYL_08100 [Planctomycetota bacterium]
MAVLTLIRRSCSRRSLPRTRLSLLRAVSNVDAAVQGDIICQISDIAIRLEQKLRWDTKKERFVNSDEANRMLKRAMRSPWRL